VSTSIENNFSRINDLYKLRNGGQIKIVHHLQDLGELKKKTYYIPSFRGHGVCHHALMGVIDGNGGDIYKEGR
jgi:hypothetical protein